MKKGCHSPYGLPWGFLWKKAYGFGHFRVPKKDGPKCFRPWPLGILVQWPEHQGRGCLQLLFSPLGM